MKKKCELCNNDFECKPSESRKFCSRKCYFKYSVGRKKKPHSEASRLLLSVLKRGVPTKHGLCLKETKCVDCGKTISDYRKTRCGSCRQIGERNPTWRGGVSNEGYSKEFTFKLRERIREKFNRKCQICGCDEKECLTRLDIHHIDNNKLNHNEDNLIPLCHICHLKIRSNEEFWNTYLVKTLEEQK